MMRKSLPLFLLIHIGMLTSCVTVDKEYIEDMSDQYAFIERGYGRVLDMAQKDGKPGYEEATVKAKKEQAALVAESIRNYLATEDQLGLRAQFAIMRQDYEKLLDLAQAEKKPGYDERTVKIKKNSCVQLKKLIDALKE